MGKFAKYEELPIVSISPEGWIRCYLEKQRDGLTGHLEAGGHPFNTRGWAARRTMHVDGGAWWPYEQTGYWIDGMIRCGHLLGDEFLLARARESTNYVLRHADRDGYLGPQFLKKEVDIPRAKLRWAHAVFFRAMMADYSATGDRKIPLALTKHYLGDKYTYSDERDAVNIEPMCWVYSVTGDRRLLKRAERAYELMNARYPNEDWSVKTMLSSRRGSEHGVTYLEICKLGVILYLAGGNRKYLDAGVNAFRKLDKYHMLIDGVPSSNEFLSGRDPMDSHETCDIADYTWSAGYLLLATGDATWADKIERACFNAAPGAVKSDFKALQYFSCPNQIVATGTSNHNPFIRGSKAMSFRLHHGAMCCPGEVNRIMPNYAARMWLSDGAGGLTAALYGPSRITAKVGAGRGREVTIVEETSYPFSDRIDFDIRTDRPVKFPLSLRIPAWCRGAKVLLNGKPLKIRTKPGSFVKIGRTFNRNDRITLVLPMKLKLSRWPGGGVGIERGPLVYSLGIAEDWRVDKADKDSTKDMPAWDLFPASEWNYALALDAGTLDRDVEVIHREYSPDPWSLEAAPIVLRVPARKVRGWKMKPTKTVMRAGFDPDGKPNWTKATAEGNGMFYLTPPLPDEKSLKKRLSKKVETITLVPYGCTHLRITIFPQCGK